MTGSVDGLVSGLRTSELIAQLMQVEAMPQTQLKAKVKTQNSIIGAYQSVNTKMKGLLTAAENLASITAWQAAKATSSSTSVVATATSGAPLGDMTFDVTRLAKAHVLTSVVPQAGPVTTGAGVDITIGTAPPVHIDVTTDTPQGVADAINLAGLDVRASVVNTEQGTILQLTSKKTGAANQFSITGLASAVQTAVTGTDAQLTVGDPLAGGYSVTSATNTFTGVMTGVTLTATKLESGVTVSVGRDSGGIADKMQALVDNANAALAEISAKTDYDPEAKKAQVLTGDYTVRQLSIQILSTVSAGKQGYGDFKQLGVSLNKDGQLVFDRDKFLNAYASDPSTVESAVKTGLAASLKAVGKGATDFTTGSLTTAIQGATSMVTSLTKQIGEWDIRLEQRQQGLVKKFANLEVALGRMRDQASWLAGQLASLPTGGGT